MNMIFTIGIVIVAISILLASWGILKYNTFVSLFAMVQEAWSGIDIQLKRRYDLIPNLVETVKGYQIHEKSLLENIAKYRTASMTAGTISEKSAAEGELSGALKTLFAVAESYPELKANENFLSLQKSLEKLEDELQISRRYYNGTARNYNIVIAHFPANIIAKLTSFTTASFFELENIDERSVPNIRF